MDDQRATQKHGKTQTLSFSLEKIITIEAF